MKKDNIQWSEFVSPVEEAIKRFLLLTPEGQSRQVHAILLAKCIVAYHGFRLYSLVKAYRTAKPGRTDWRGILRAKKELRVEFARNKISSRDMNVLFRLLKNSTGINYQSVVIPVLSDKEILAAILGTTPDANKILQIAEQAEKERTPATEVPIRRIFITAIIEACKNDMDATQEFFNVIMNSALKQLHYSMKNWIKTQPLETRKRLRKSIYKGKINNRHIIAYVGAHYKGRSKGFEKTFYRMLKEYGLNKRHTPSAQKHLGILLPY